MCQEKNLLDVEESLWAGPTRGLWFFVRGACGRDPPGGEALEKKTRLDLTREPMAWALRPTLPHRFTGQVWSSVGSEHN